MSPEIITLIFILAILVGGITGYPIALILGGSTLLIGLWHLGPMAISLIYMRSFTQLMNYTMLAIPLFVFMGYLLGHSGVAKKLYDTLYLLMARTKGGLAAATIIIGAIIAACVGVIGASIAILTVLALPSMLEKKYDKSIASGTICAAGTLGILIPPSVMLVVYGPMAQLSVGRLFLGAFMPGFLLAAAYVIYILIVCRINPILGPQSYEEDILSVPLSKKLYMLLTSLVPLVFIILAVLGVIYLGIAAATEAAAMGCLGAIILCVAYKKFNLKLIKDALLDTVMVSSYIAAVGLFANALVGVFLKLGCGEVISNVILSAPGGKWGSFLIIMIVLFLLGMFIDWIGIIFIMVPLISPIAIKLGFDPIWFAILVCVNLQLSFMTPPMAPAIFYFRGMVPKDAGINTAHIIKGVLPYLVIVFLVIVILVAFPGIVTWLPNSMTRTGW